MWSPPRRGGCYQLCGRRPGKYQTPGSTQGSPHTRNYPPLVEKRIFQNVPEPWTGLLSPGHCLALQPKASHLPLCAGSLHLEAGYLPRVGPGGPPGRTRLTLLQDRCLENKGPILLLCVDLQREQKHPLWPEADRAASFPEIVCSSTPARLPGPEQPALQGQMGAYVGVSLHRVGSPGPGRLVLRPQG